MENKVKVRILGNTYSIQGDASPEYIHKLAGYVNDKMEEVSGSIADGNQAQVAILTALNIADEYFQLRELKTGLSGDLEQKTRTLISLLDEGLVGDIFANYSRTGSQV